MTNTGVFKTSRCIHRPLIPMAVALMVGITGGTWQPGFWTWSLCAIAVVAIVLSLQILKKRQALIAPLILCALVGYLSIQPWLGGDPPRHHVVHFADQGYWKIQGVVAARPTIKKGRWQFELSARRLTNKDAGFEVCGRIRVTGRGEWPGPDIGDRVTFRGRLRTIRSFTNPGGFDYERYMRLKGIRARVYASAKSLMIESRAPSAGLEQRIQLLGDRLSSLMDAALGARRPETLSLLKALILGDRDQISSDFREQFNRAGVGHVLAISGLHVGMVAAVSFAVAAWILAAVPPVLKLAWVRRGAALVSLGPVLVYGILAGLSPSTQRAMLMVSVFLLGLWIGRRHDWLNTLAVAALVILILHPPALLSISFQLSFVAVLAIVAGSTLWSGGTDAVPPNFGKKLQRRFLSFIGVSAMAILGTLPLVLHYFNQASVVGLASNLVVVPLVGVVVVPAGLLGAVSIDLIPVLGEFCWQVAAWGADLICWLVRNVASWPWASFQIVTPSVVEVVLYYLLCALWLYRKKLPYRKTVTVAVVALCLLDTGYWLYQRHGRTDLRVTALDVGQASANLLELPGGFTMMVDGGGFSDNAAFDVGARIVAPILWRKKIRTIDLVVLTHANSDHLNGLLYIVEHFHVGEVWSNHEPAPTKGYRHWIKLLADGHVRHVAFDQLPRHTVRQGVHLEILAPPANFMAHQSEALDGDLNNNSLVLRVYHGKVSFLFTGDIMKSGESGLVARLGADGLRSTVLMVPHHGSRTSSSQAFIGAVQPAEAVISAGWQNRFRFPHGDVMGRLATEGCRIWCTAESGAVEIATDGKGYAITTFRHHAP